MRLGCTLAWLALLLGIVFAQAQCGDYGLTDIGVSTNLLCTGAVPIESARVYSGEDYYICATLLRDGDRVGSGAVVAYEPHIMDTTASVRSEGLVVLPGHAGTTTHRVYYIMANLTGLDACELSPIPLEVQASCTLLPPSTVQAVPNRVYTGESFTVEIANADRELDVEIALVGREKVRSTISRGAVWSREFDACCDPGEMDHCTCELSFSFAERDHPICRNSATRIAVKVYSNGSVPDADGQGMGLETLVVLAIIIIGTAIAVLRQ